MSQSSDAILQRMMALHPKIIDLTLNRVHQLLARLDHPERRLPPVIHVAGTNGKGSTQAMIRTGLEADGHKVHAYTSPHLARFHERIRLAGTLISEPALSELLDRCYASNDGAPITYFEITTVAGLLAMAETPADYTLLEVGLGGRLDATNVVDQPALTVITPVDLDHQSFLGETLAQIASEKAGILKPGVPCIVAQQHDEALDAIETQAARVGAPLVTHGQHWHARSEDGRLVVEHENGLLDLPLPRLAGPHQIINAGSAVMALLQLGATDQALEAALTRTQWPARMQRLTSGPLLQAANGAELWLDGGHNPAAGRMLAATLAQLPPKPVHLICGMLNTKDVAGYLHPLAKHAESLTALSIPGETATLSAQETAAIAQSVGLKAQTATDLRSAIANTGAPDRRLLICGSLYLAGHVLRENESLS